MNIKRLKVVTVIGTRPEIIRLSRVLAALENSSAIDHVLVHTGQNYDYELNEIFFNDLGVKRPNHFLNAAGNSAIHTIGNAIAAVEPILIDEKPDAFLVLGDTNSCLCAIPAKKMQIPVFHMEAGNRCFDQRVPEEINRKIVDHISDINLTYSSIAREYLLNEGLAPERVIKTGSPMFEVLNHYRSGIQESTILEKLELEAGKYFVVSSHRAENVDPEHQFKKIASIINRVAEEYNLPIIVSTHPRTQNRIDALGLTFHSKVRLLKPLGFLDYVRLQQSSKATLSDSGTISEESSILGFPALNLREAHERPEAMEEAAVIMTGLNEDRVLQGLAVLQDQANQTPPYRSRMVADYTMPDVSQKVLQIILSYSDYIQRVVWRKN